MKFIDITMALYEGMGCGNVFPQESSFKVEDIYTFEKNRLRLVRICMFQEPGTRLMLRSIISDYRNGTKIDELPLEETVMVNACIIDMPIPAEHAISAQEIEEAVGSSPIQHGDAMLFHTGWGDHQRYLEMGDDYPLKGPWFTIEACDKIIETGKRYDSKIFGYDTANVMPYDRLKDWWERKPRPENFPSREAKEYLETVGIRDPEKSGALRILASGMAMLGGIVNLGEATKKRVKLVALPLKLKGLGGGPVRAILLEE